MENDTICGRHAVEALFARRPDDVLRLFYQEDMHGIAGKLCAVMARSRKPYRQLDAADMLKLTKTEHHGGIAAVALARHVPFLEIEKPPVGNLLLVLDGIGNPHNLGAIVRSAAFFGVRSILLTDAPGHAMPSNAAYRTAAGGFEHVDLWRTKDLPRALGMLAPHFRAVAAALTPGAVPLKEFRRDRAIALVIGNEERGVSDAVLEACRRHVRIPGTNAVQSLNAAQSAAVLLAELTSAS